MAVLNAHCEHVIEKREVKGHLHHCASDFEGADNKEKEDEAGDSVCVSVTGTVQPSLPSAHLNRETSPIALLPSSL